MNELDRLIFEDFILCFFKCQRYLNKENWRELFLIRFIEVFPENEVCDLACVFFDYRFDSLPANYIKEIN